MKKLFTLGAIALLAIPALTAQAALSNPTVSPTPNGTEAYGGQDLIYNPGDITQIVLEWPGTDLDLTSKAEIKVEDTWTWNSTPLDSDKYSVDGSKLIINVEFDQPNVTYYLHVMQGTVQDHTTGETNSYVNNLTYIIYPVQINKEDVVSNPMWGSELESIPQTITVEFPGWTVSQGDMWDYRTARIRFGSGNSAYDVSDLPNTNVTSVTLADNKLTIQLNKEYTDVGWYTLGINYETLSFSNDQYQNIDVDTNTGLLLMFNVVGYSAVPANMSIYMGEFDTFTVYASNISVPAGSDLSKIKVKYTDLSVLDASPVTVNPASYNSVTDDNGTGIQFKLSEPIAFSSSAIEVTIPQGWLKTGTSNLPQITLTYSQRLEIPEATVNPATGSTLNGLNQVTLNWADSDVSLNSGNPTIQLDGGNAISLTPYVKIENDEIPTETEFPLLENGKLIFDFTNHPVVTPGEYTIQVPAGLITAGKFKDKNSEVTLTYTVNSTELTEVTASPAEGVIESLNSISFTWPQAADQTLMPNDVLGAKKISVTLGGQTYEGSYSTSIEGNTLTVTFDEAVTTEGVLAVNVPEGYLGVITDADAWYTCAASASYTIGVPEENIGVLEAEPTVTPEDGSTIENRTVVTVTWNMALTSNPFSESGITLNGNALTDVSVEGETISITLRGLEDGEYTVVIPAEFVIAENEDGEKFYNQEVTLVYKVGNQTPEEPEYIDGATAMEIFGEEGIIGLIINWDDYEIAFNEEFDGEVTVTGQTPGVPMIASVEIYSPQLIILFEEELVEETELTVNIPQAYVFVGTEGALNKAQTLKLTTTGVASIGSEMNFEGIYTIQGVRVNAEKASQLGKGLYIINGKKVVIK